MCVFMSHHVYIQFFIHMQYITAFVYSDVSMFMQVGSYLDLCMCVQYMSLPASVLGEGHGVPLMQVEVSGQLPQVGLGL